MQTAVKPQVKLTKEFIHKFENILSKFPQIKIKTKHYFTEGVYAREITIPAGVILTGKTHKTEHLNIISKGEIKILTENDVQHVKAPYTIKSKPGVKRVGHAVTETVWTTIHPNKDNITDLKKLEEIFIDNSEYLKIENGEKLWLG